jgi:hypothetical protein
MERTLVVGFSLSFTFAVVYEPVEPFFKSAFEFEERKSAFEPFFFKLELDPDDFNGVAESFRAVILH